MSIQDELNLFLEGLKQQRDEVRVQLHLASAELKQDWEKLEGQLSSLEDKVEEVNSAVGATAENVAAAAKLAAEEIAKGYQRIRKLL